MYGLMIKVRSPGDTEHSPDDLLLARDVRRMFGNITDVSLWRWMKSQTLNFPQPAVTIGRMHLWRFGDLKRWQEERAAKASK